MIRLLIDSPQSELACPLMPVVMSQIRQAYPSAQIVAMSSRPETRQVALEAGADAFVCKGDPPETLLAVLDDWEFKL